MPRRSLRALAVAVGASLASLLFAAPARAEEVVTAAGHRYDATEVEILGGEKVRFTYRVGSGRAVVTLPASAIQPRSLFHLVLARTPPDAASQMRLGWFALERGLLPEAEARFRRAAQADPALAAERDRGLAAIAAKRLEAVLAAAEADLRGGRFAAGMAKAADVAARAEPGSELAARATGLVEMARRRDEQESRRRAEEAAARAEAVAAAEVSALEAALVAADKAVLDAIERRRRIAVPGIAAARVRTELEAAEALLREGRRLLGGAVDLVPARREEVLARDDQALGLLVATLLDLADSHRQGGRLTKAREHVRSALLLDPDNVRALEVQRQIEDALRGPVYDEPYAEPYFSPYTGYGVVSTSPYRVYRVHRGRSWFHGLGRHWHVHAGW